MSNDNNEEKLPDVKVTTSMEVTPEDLTPDLLEVDDSVRGPTNKHVAGELARTAMVNFLSKLGFIHGKLKEDLRLQAMFGELAKYGRELIENSRWWDRVREEWVDIEWSPELDHVRFAIIEKYDLVFDKCEEMEELFRELENLHAILEKIAAGSKQ